MAFRIAVDFDGTLHDHHNIPDGDIFGPPMEGALEAITQLRKRYDVYILTARDAKGREDARRWLRNYRFPDMLVTNVKLPCVAYFDDRGVHFTNWDTALQEFRSYEGQLVQSFILDSSYTTR